LAPKIIHTRSNLDPEPPNILDDPEKILRKIRLAESQGSNSPLSRENSLPENLNTIQDIQFDLPFEHSLFKTKYESCVDQTVIDEYVL